MDVDDSTRTLNKKVREGQVAQYNFILVVGEKEVQSNSVAVRTRDIDGAKEMSVDHLIDMFKDMSDNYKPMPEPVKKEEGEKSEATSIRTQIKFSVNNGVDR